jgi:hypothetical protein
LSTQRAIANEISKTAVSLNLLTTKATGNPVEGGSSNALIVSTLDATTSTDGKSKKKLQ